jgi:hypothetical protein
LFQESISKITPFLDPYVIQDHVPTERRTDQAVLEEMDEKLLIAYDPLILSQYDLSHFVTV